MCSIKAGGLGSWQNYNFPICFPYCPSACFEMFKCTPLSLKFLILCIEPRGESMMTKTFVIQFFVLFLYSCVQMERPE